MLNNPRCKTGWNVQARVQIKMHEKDRNLKESLIIKSLKHLEEGGLAVKEILQASL